MTTNCASGWWGPSGDVATTHSARSRQVLSHRGLASGTRCPRAQRNPSCHLRTRPTGRPDLADPDLAPCRPRYLRTEQVESCPSGPASGVRGGVLELRSQWGQPWPRDAGSAGGRASGGSCPCSGYSSGPRGRGDRGDEQGTSVGAAAALLDRGRLTVAWSAGAAASVRPGASVCCGAAAWAESGTGGWPGPAGWPRGGPGAPPGRAGRRCPAAGRRPRPSPAV